LDILYIFSLKWKEGIMPIIISCHHVDKREAIVKFNTPGAMLPFIDENSTARLIVWGRRRDELGDLPFGPNATLAHIEAGWWDNFNLEYVPIPYTGFMEQNFAGVYKWHKNTNTNALHLQGVIASFDMERRLYIVIDKADHEKQPFHEKWPRILQPIYF